MKVLAPAKVNIGLWVLRKRKDGYHDIITVFHKIPLYDELTIEVSDSFSISCTFCPEDERNSVYRAYRLLKELVGFKESFKVKIKKRIPMQAGLGGGSSDAAIFLKTVNKMLDLGLGLKELIGIGMKIGADVPFFLLEENAAIGMGKGEELIPFNSRLNALFEIVKPEFGIPTGWAYSLIDALSLYSQESEAIRKAETIKRELEEGKIPDAELIYNPFEFVAGERFPEIKFIKQKLLKKGASFSVLSGSGSAVFGVFPDKNLKVNYREENYE